MNKLMRYRNSLLQKFQSKDNMIQISDLLDHVIDDYLVKADPVFLNKSLISSIDPADKFLNLGVFDPDEANYKLYRECHSNADIIKIYDSTCDFFLEPVDENPSIVSIHHLLWFIDTTVGPTHCAIMSPEALVYKQFRYITVSFPISEFFMTLVHLNGYKLDANLAKCINALSNDYQWFQAYSNFDCTRTITKVWDRIITVSDLHMVDPDMSDTLLMMANSDVLNPGPVFTLPRKLAKIIPDDRCIVTLPNNRTFIISDGKYKFSEDSVEITSNDSDFADEMNGVIHLNKYKSQTKMRGKFNIGRDSSYSNHTNFDIDKRVPIKLKSALNGHFTELFPQETEGTFVVVDNFTFIPRNLLRFMYQRKAYTSDNSLMVVSYDVMYSVERQELTREQLIKTAIKLTTMQMAMMENEHSFDRYINVFAGLLITNIDGLNVSRKNQLSFADVWNEILTNKYPVIIPTNVVYFGNVNELFLTEKTMKNVSSIPSVGDMILAQPGLELYDFDDETKSMDQLISDFSSGKMRCCRAKTVIMKFDFSIEKIPLVLRQKGDDFTETEKFFEKFIFNRMLDADINRCFINAIAHVQSSTLMRRLMRIFSEKQFGAKIGANLVKMMIRPIESSISASELEAKLAHDIIRDPNMHTEKQIAQRAQLEFQIFTSEFGCYSNKNVFNNVETVKAVYNMRRSPPEDSGLFESIKGMFNSAREGITEVVQAKGTLKELNTLWADNRDKLNNLLKIDEKHKPIFDKMDFSTFSSSLEAAKAMIDGLFAVMMKKVADFIGIDFSNTMDLTTAVFYYIIWINTDNKFLRYMLILDICSKLNIVDVVLGLIRKIWNSISRRFNTETGRHRKKKPTRSSAVDEGMEEYEDSDYDDEPDVLDDTPETSSARRFESLFDNLETQMRDISTKNYAKTAELPEEELDFEKPSEDFITTFTDYFKKGIPYVLGATAIALVSAFGLPKIGMKCSVLGNDIVSTARNISFIAAGMAGIPKIYAHIMSVISWVIDYGKKIIYKDHKTKYEINEQAVEWCRVASKYIQSSGYLIVKSPEFCITYLQLHKQMLYLNSKIDSLKRPVAIVYNDTKKHFTQMYELVRATMAAIFPLQEMMHVMFTGEPGVGKTDLADQGVKIMLEALREQTIVNTLSIPNDKCRAAMLETLTKTSAFGDVYNMSESAKFMDNY